MIYRNGIYPDFKIGSIVQWVSDPEFGIITDISKDGIFVFWFCDSKTYRYRTIESRSLRLHDK